MAQTIKAKGEWVKEELILISYIYKAFKTFHIHFIYSRQYLGSTLSQDHNSCFMNEGIEAQEG